MTRIPNPDTVFPHFIGRQESGGHVVYAPGSGEYLFTNDDGYSILCQGRQATCSAEMIKYMSDEFGYSETDASGWLDDASALLMGRPTENKGKTAAADRPRIVPLADALGENTDRCSTFGMPL